METKATLKVVRTRVKCVLIYSNIETATLCSLLRTQVANFIVKMYNALQLCTSNRLVDYQLPCPPLNSLTVLQNYSLIILSQPALRQQLLSVKSLFNGVKSHG